MKSTCIKCGLEHKDSPPYCYFCKCSKCGSEHIGSSPCGSWCNKCGWQSCCPCWNGREKECGVCNKHKHIWNESGECIAMEGCAAKQKYNEGV